MVVLEEVEMVDTLTLEEVEMDTLEVGLESQFKDGTEAPPQVIQLVIEIGKFFTGGSFCFSFFVLNLVINTRSIHP